MTRGREGLANYACLCGQVVEEYRRDLARLHRDALSLRVQFLSDSLAPRIEARSVYGEPVLNSDLRSLALRASRETGVPRRLFVFYRRKGSVLEGAVLVLFGALAAPLGERFVRWVEAHVRGRRLGEDVELIRNQTWIDLRDGRGIKVEERLILYYLPSARVDSLDAKSRRALARYLSAILGVGRVREPDRSKLPAPSPRRTREIEVKLDVRLGGLSRRALAELDSLVRVADTKGLRRAAKELHQTKLDEFSDA